MEKQKNNSRKGFLFVVTIFLILTYILLSISVWVKSIEASERAYSEFYKESNVELAIEQITDEKLDSATSKVMNRGLLVITRHSADHAFIGDGTDHKNVTKAFNEWLIAGSVDKKYFVGDVAPPEENSSMKAWVDNLNSSLLGVGVYVDTFEITNFKLEQTSHDALDYSFDVNLSIKDKSGTTSVDRIYPIKNTLNITGIPDPAIIRESKGEIKSRRFFFNDDLSTTTKIKPVSTGTGKAGQGWFYGFLVNTSVADAVPTYERGRYILIGTFDEIEKFPNYLQFGAFIVTSDIVPGKPCGPKVSETKTFNPISYNAVCDPSIDHAQGSDMSKPFVVAPNFNIDTDAGICPKFNDSPEYVPDEKCVLFVGSADLGPLDSEPEAKLANPKPKFYNIEKLRDFTLCGYYTQDKDSSSFMQRLYKDSYAMKSTQYGITTFLVGNYTLDAMGHKYQDTRRLDKEFFKDPPIDGHMIRGMPGCKDFEMCSVPNNFIGRFALSKNTISKFGLGNIACDPSNGYARCE